MSWIMAQTSTGLIPENVQAYVLSFSPQFLFHLVPLNLPPWIQSFISAYLDCMQQESCPISPTQFFIKPMAHCAKLFLKISSFPAA